MSDTNVKVSEDVGVIADAEAEVEDGDVEVVEQFIRW